MPKGFDMSQHGLRGFRVTTHHGGIFATACEDRESIERKQLARLIDKAWRTYQVPFHRDRWDSAGFHPSQIKSLDDLWRAPRHLHLRKHQVTRNATCPSF